MTSGFSSECVFYFPNHGRHCQRMEWNWYRLKKRQFHSEHIPSAFCVASFLWRGRGSMLKETLQLREQIKLNIISFDLRLFFCLFFSLVVHWIWDTHAHRNHGSWGSWDVQAFGEQFEPPRPGLADWLPQINWGFWGVYHGISTYITSMYVCICIYIYISQSIFGSDLFSNDQGSSPEQVVYIRCQGLVDWQLCNDDGGWHIGEHSPAGRQVGIRGSSAQDTGPPIWLWLNELVVIWLIKLDITN